MAWTLGLAGWRRGRRAADEFAGLVEATVDVRLALLAGHLGVELVDGCLTRASAHRINDQLAKGRW